LGEALSGTPTAAPGTEAAGTTLDGATTEAVGAAGENEPESVSRGYVTELQGGLRLPGSRPGGRMTPRPRLRELAISQAVSDVLMSADDLSWSDALADEHGYPDPDLILAAAVELVARMPHPARPRGDLARVVAATCSPCRSVACVAPDRRRRAGRSCRYDYPANRCGWMEPTAGGDGMSVLCRLARKVTARKLTLITSVTPRH